MTCGCGMGMVIVVPALAETDESDPPVVPRIIASGEPARAPHVSTRIDEPRSVEAHHYSQADTPKDQAKISDGEQHHTGRKGGNPVIVIQPDVKTVLCEVGGIF